MAAAAEILDVCLPKKPRNVLISLQLWHTVFVASGQHRRTTEQHPEHHWTSGRELSQILHW